LFNPEISLSEHIGMDEIILEADSRLDDKDLIHIGELEFEVIHTPGHTARWNMYIFKRKKSFVFRRYFV